MRIALREMNGAEHPVGAAVVRTQPNGEITLDLGPADGAPLWGLLLERAEALQLRDALGHVLSSGGESVLILET